MHNKLTLVTGLWDIKRSELSDGWNRSFQEHYIPKFIELLKNVDNLIVFGDEKLQEVVFKYRTLENTQFILRSQDWFKNEFYEPIQTIRNNPSWYNQAGWLKESTQGSLEMYNPLVMSKMMLLQDAKILDKFNSEHLYWIDAGITSTVHPGYFSKDKVLDKLTELVDKFNFIAFPYEASTEIHGFTYPDIEKYAGAKVKLVGRGGFFGGPVETIKQAFELYYNVLKRTLNDGYMGTEESIFSILLYNNPSIFTYSLVESNGLIGKFFEDLKNNKAKINNTDNKPVLKPLNFEKVGIYVLTYNSPNQFKKLCKSFENYDKDYLNLPKKYLLNNSIDKSTDKEYNQLCEQYGFQQIKKDNIGICGGRQYIAEHFDNQQDLDYYMFFEDDMFFYGGQSQVCRNGFQRKIESLYKKSFKIVHNEQFDFLKLNFTEFYGDNSKQWSWHNVPPNIREELFPDKPKKTNDDVNQAPFLKYLNIKSSYGISYATGEIYYCNWPQIVSREGNKKMFLNTVFENPFEQTWMSFIYQETVKGNIKPGLLLATPTEHDRFEFYPKEERKEN